MNTLRMSVVVPTRNRHASVARVIERLSRQTLPPDAYEIVVVDDGSSPPVQIITSVERPRVLLIRMEGVERSAARNAGARAAQGELLVFVDDDILVEPGFLEAHAEAHRLWPGGLVTGQTVLPDSVRETPFGRFRHQLEQAAVPRQAGPTCQANLCAANNASLARVDFLALHGFDPGLTCAEDQDLALRHAATGGPVVFCPEALGHHDDSVITIAAYCRHEETGGRRMIRFLEKYPAWPENLERVRVNGRLRLFREPLRLSIKKLVKWVLACRPFSDLIVLCAQVATDVVPRSPWVPWLYRVALGIHIFRGHRSGLKIVRAVLAARPRRLVHLALDDDTSGYFPQLARWHDAKRYRMTFATLRPMAPWLRAHMESLGIACFSCDCRSRATYLLGLLRLVLFLRRERAAIVHTHLFDPSVVGLPAAFLAGGSLRVETRHYSDYHTRIHKRWHVKLDQMCTRLAHAVIAVSQHTADHLVAVEGAPSDKVVTVRNGIDFDRVRTSGQEAVGRIRGQFAPGDTALLVSAGRLHPEKGYEHLFAALPELRRRVTRPWVLLVAGRGPFEQIYKDLVRQIHCDDVVHFLGFRRDIPDVLAAADIMVLASVAEAFGLVLAEALFLGTPVVATRVGGIPEIVDDGVDGRLVPPGDSDALAAVLAELLNDSEKLRILRDAGRDKVRERFSFEKMTRSYEAVYDDRIERRARND